MFFIFQVFLSLAEQVFNTMFGSGEKARENKGERKMGGKCYFPPFGSAKKTEREGK